MLLLVPTSLHPAFSSKGMLQPTKGRSGAVSVVLTETEAVRHIAGMEIFRGMETFPVGVGTNLPSVIRSRT